MRTGRGQWRLKPRNMWRSSFSWRFHRINKCWKIWYLWVSIDNTTASSRLTGCQGAKITPSQPAANIKNMIANTRKITMSIYIVCQIYGMHLAYLMFRIYSIYYRCILYVWYVLGCWCILYVWCTVYILWIVCDGHILYTSCIYYVYHAYFVNSCILRIFKICVRNFQTQRSNW